MLHASRCRRQHVPSAQVLCAAPEYDELPVRHNEDKLNAVMARSGEAVRVEVDLRAMDDPHTKASLLLQVSEGARAKKGGGVQGGRGAHVDSAPGGTCSLEVDCMPACRSWLLLTGSRCKWRGLLERDVCTRCVPCVPRAGRTAGPHLACRV